VHHIIHAIFRRTGEFVFDRIFHRPLGFQIMKEFCCSSSYAETCPAAKHVLLFYEAINKLTVEDASTASEQAEQVSQAYMGNPVSWTCWATKRGGRSLHFVAVAGNRLWLRCWRRMRCKPLAPR
jgi:hypothetical protein